MTATKPIYMTTRLEKSLAEDYKMLCELKHIAPSTMLRVLVHSYVESHGLQPDPLEVVDALAKQRQNWKRDPDREPKK